MIRPLRGLVAAALPLIVFLSGAQAQTFTQVAWGINRGATPSPICVQNGSACLAQLGTVDTGTGAFSLTVVNGTFAQTAPAPAWTTQFGVFTPNRVLLGNAYANSELFGQSTVPVANAITGIVNAPSNAYLGGGLFTGISGYALAGDNSNSPVGVFGFGGRTGPGTTNYPGAWAFNGIVTNASNTANTHNDARDHVQLYAMELNQNVYSAGTNSLGIAGLYIIGGGNWVPISTNLARAVDLDVLSVVGNIPWNEAIYIRDGAATLAGISVGTTGTGNNVGSQAIRLRSRNAGGTNKTYSWFTDTEGDGLFVPPANGITQFQDGNGNAILSLSGPLGVNFPTLTGYMKAAGTAATTASATIPTTDLSGTVTAAQGGTGQAGGYAVGDILYASGASALSKLADVATGNALISGGIGAAPSWGKIGISTHVSGLGTGVATALGVNVGAAGAFLVNGNAFYRCGSLVGANFNSTADQPITISQPDTNYVVQSIQITNPSVSMTTAVGGFYTGAGKTGLAVVANSQVYSLLTTNAANTAGNRMVAAVASTSYVNVATIYFALSTPQGVAATADIDIYCIPLR